MTKPSVSNHFKSRKPSAIRQAQIKFSKRPIINLHISYLPYNKGSHPNFWSFVEKTPKGVTIHEIDKKVDNGPIIARRKIVFKKQNNLTFKNTQEFLIKEIEKLFIQNYVKILSGNYSIKKVSSKGTFHKSSQLPKNIKTWNIKIFDYLKNYTK